MAFGLLETSSLYTEKKKKKQLKTGGRSSDKCVPHQTPQGGCTRTVSAPWTRLHTLRHHSHVLWLAEPASPETPE